jgi:hypothetical protein
MSNYLKKFLFTILIFGMPYMNSTSNAMDNVNKAGDRTRGIPTQQKQPQQREKVIPTGNGRGINIEFVVPKKPKPGNFDDCDRPGNPGQWNRGGSS